MPKVTLPITPGKILIFCHNHMGYTYMPRHHSDLAIQSWLLEQPQELFLRTFEGTQADLEAIIGGPPQAPEDQVHITNAACHFPGGSYGLARDWCAYCAQTDCYLKVPGFRFDMDLYYNNDPGQFEASGKSVSCHSGFIGDQEWINFDNDFFGMSELVASTIVPCQRLCLECAVEAMHEAGYTRKKIAGKKMVTIVCDIGLDWDPFHTYGVDGDVWARTNNTLSVNRLCHTLGMTGPSIQLDTACSASMVGSALAHQHLLNFRSEARTPMDLGMVTGFQNILSHFTYIGLSAAGMLGRTGRCLFADNTGNGFSRGEGCGNMIAKLSDDPEITQDRLAAMVGSYVNQDGRSASLTAPNGPSQQAVMRGSHKQAGITGDMLVSQENHGTGTALGDPIECGTVQAVLRGRKWPVCVTSGKSHMGHLEPAAGLIGIFKTICMIEHACIPANCHLGNLNAHIEYNGFPGTFPIEKCDIASEDHYAGANGFGFGGTNARTDFWGRRKDRLRTTPSQIVGQKVVIDKLDAFNVLPVGVDKLACISVTCPRCLGSMCCLCSMAIDPGDPGKHYCRAVRDEFASYDYCSKCYDGAYQWGGPEREGAVAVAAERVFLVGTWSAWSTQTEMERMPGGEYVGEIVLGETRMERFQLAVEKSEQLPSSGKTDRPRLYPVVDKANSRAEILGPDHKGHHKNWLIDGRLDGVPVGTVYKVTFKWGDSQKWLSWEATDRTQSFEGYEHTYFIIGSISHGEVQEMIPEGPNWWRFHGRIGSTAMETFSIIRDGDRSQEIYPLTGKPNEESVPVMGPDDGSTSQKWLAWGSYQDPAVIDLRIIDVQWGIMMVTATTSTMGELSWTSTGGPMYYVAASWNEWSFEDLMKADDTKKHVYRCSFVMGSSGREEFQIIVNQNWSNRMYPGAARQQPGAGVLQGPDAGGDGLNWLVEGYPGQEMEITLDLKAKDNRQMVTCTPSGRSQ
mmetsp:Transcript_43950/g.95593  ORF Transcript_43950/g.95593 Transcript_43950/m.95593 type:complete len:965 (+) Transcript_43950:3-2897(+)